MACGRVPDKEDPLSHYCISRLDLSLGLISANLIHAAGESGPATEHTHAVSLATPDEASLRAIADRLTKAGIEFTAIIECDGDHAGQMMAIGCKPVLKSRIRKHLSSLPLLK